MEPYQILSLVIASFAILISSGALCLSYKANQLNRNLFESQKSMFKRQHVIDLYQAWEGVSEIDRTNLVAPDIVKAVNTMALTASLWNHGIIEKSILYQSYWIPYKTLYEQINSIDELIPGKNQTCKSLLTSEIRKAYRGMDEIDLNSVTQTDV